MSPIHAIQPTFAGGEFAPELQARVDLQKYSTGLSLLHNFIPRPTGGVYNRPGTKYVASSKFSNRKARLVTFVFSSTQAYAIEFGHLYARFYTNDGQIVSGGNPVEIVTPYAEADLPLLNYTQSADTLFLAHPSYAPQTLSRITNTSWSIGAYGYLRGPFRLANTDTSKTLQVSAVSGAGVTVTASSNVFDPAQVGALFEIRQDVSAPKDTAAFTGLGNGGTIPCMSGWRLTTHGTWAGEFVLEKSLDGGTTWITIRTFTGSSDINYDTSGTEQNDEGRTPFKIRFRCTVFSGGTLNIALSCNAFTQVGVVKITGYTSATAATATVLDALATAGAGGATSDWAEGSWSNFRGFPACVAFHPGDRLIWAATAGEPQTEWATQTGNYYDFGRSNPLVDSDGISVNLPSRQLNGIRSLTPLVDILAFTSASEWTVGPQDAPLTPTSVNPKIHSQFGSNGIAPVVVGNRAIFIQPMNSTVRDIGYDFSVNGFSGDALSLVANHLFRGFTIVDMAYQQEPDSVIWFVRSDGIAVSMTYLREQQVLACAWHDTQGTIEAVCVIPGDGFNEVWFVVNRAGGRFIERLTKRQPTLDPKDQFFVDAGVSYDFPVTISGATQANPVVITATAHGFSNGDTVDIRNVAGMTSINGRRFIVAGATANTFQLHKPDGTNEDGTAYPAYVSGGEVRKAVSALSGYAHLEGQKVSVLADGNVFRDKLVTGGQIALDVPASIVHAGLPYKAELKTLKPEIPLRDGTLQDRKVRYARATIKVMNSRGGKIGQTADDTTSMSQRGSEPLGSPTALFTGDAPFTIPGGYDLAGQIYIAQEDPLPLMVLAIEPTLIPGGQ